MQKAVLLLAFLTLTSLFALTAGCAQKEEPPTLTLSIRNVELCSAVSEDGDYTVQPGATFDRGDTAYLYFEVPGITVKAVDGKFECWTKFSVLKIFDPNGDMIGHMVDFGEFHWVDMDEPPKFGWYCWWYESSTDDEPGQYRFEFTITDELSGATGTGSAYFNLQ